MTHGATRVVMMVQNDVAADSRVKKEALALAEAGMDVIVLGVTSERAPHSENLGENGAFLLRVPVRFTLSEERNRRRARRRKITIPGLGYPNSNVKTARQARIRARRADIAAEKARASVKRAAGKVRALSAVAGAAARKIQWFRWRAAGAVIKVRHGLGYRAYRFRDRAWNAFDRRFGKVRLGARWRSIHPDIDDYDAAFGPVIDALKPDVIHAHDMHVLGIATKAAWRARAAGRAVDVVYDSHEFVAGLAEYGSRTPRYLAGWADLEAEYIHDADRVITVGPALATAIERRYRLTDTPAVVLNTPDLVKHTGDVPSVRTRAGVDEHTPLAVYSGGLTKVRGVNLAISALEELPDVHLAIVCVPHTDTWFVRQLRDEVADLGLSELVHFVDPVPPGQVVEFLSSADVGVHPMVGGFANHEMALPNKLFEYIHAGLPLVVTNLQQLGAFVTERGIGEAFNSGDAHDLAGKLRSVLENRERYRRAVSDPELREEFSWKRQTAVLRDVYASLGHSVSSNVTPDDALENTTASAPANVRLLIGPANMAGQGYEWSRAVERNLPGANASALMVGERPFTADITASEQKYRSDVEWQVSQARRISREYSHVLVESARPLAGLLNGKGFRGEAAMLRDSGVAVGLILHGSEARDPRRHYELYPYSVFGNPRDPETSRLQKVVDDVLAQVEDFDGPVWVASPDLPDYVPNATWLPFTVDVDRFASDAPVLERKRPVVVYAPTNGWLKGASDVDPELQRLDEAGLIHYLRVEGVGHEELVQLIRTSDIVVDQTRLGIYGVTSAEAMAAGRVTVSHVASRVRERLPGELPIVEATPEDFGSVIERLVTDRDEGIKAAAASAEYARTYHDGREAARRLSPFLVG